MLVDALILLFLAFVLSVFVPVLCHPWNNPPPVPSFGCHRAAVIELIKSLQLKDPKIVELGSGWGGLTRKLSALGRVTAIEKSHSLVWLMRLQMAGSGVNTLRCDAVSQTSREVCQDAQVAVMYLSQGLNQAIVELLPRGIHVVSIYFPITGIELIERRLTPAGQVFLYRT